MNQILSMGENNNNNSKSGINKIVVTFCIIIIIFALTLGGIGVYKLINEKDKKTYSEPAPTVEVVNANSNSGSAIIKVSSKSGVSKLIYTWDDGEENPINEQNKTEIEEQIIVPNGNCTLNIKIIEENGRESKFKKEFIYDSNKDTIAPDIKIAGENKKVSIVVTDNKELYAIAYKWNDEEATTITPEEGDKTTIKTTIEAKKGRNVLTVVAKDKEGNVKKEEEEIIVASKPKISVTRSNGTLRIIATDEDELTKIQYAVNDKTETVEIKDKNKKQIEIKEKLQKGENKIAIIVENKSGLKQTYVGKCTYNP